MPREFRPPTDEQRCTATTRKGTRCPKFRVKGATVCLSHGALAPQVRAAADRREADRKALELAGRLDVDVPEFASAGDAARYLVSRVTRRAAQFGALADQHGDDLTYTDRAGTERLRAAVDGERKWLDSLARVLSAATQAEAAGRGSADAVEVFKMTVGLFEEDVAAALCDVGIYGEQHEHIMARVRARAGLRLRQSEGMITEQIRLIQMRARAADGPVVNGGRAAR